MVSFKGFMIPGLYLESDYCILFYRWKGSPISAKQLSEVWIIHPDNKKVCYIDPKEGIPIFNKYHTFDEVSEAKISIEEKENYLNVLVYENNIKILQIEIKTKSTFESSIINFLLKFSKSEKLYKKGRTETGKEFINKPERIDKISDAKVIFMEKDLGKIIKPRKIIKFGHSEINDKPIINYCTQDVED